MRMKFTGTLGAAVASLLVLSACGGDGATTADSDGGNRPQQGRQINETPRDKLRQGGTLRRAVAELPAQWNPLHVNGNRLDFTDVRETMSVINWDYDAQDNFTPNENYLTDYEEAEVDGKTVITLHLNPEAKWNNGDPIDAADYQATIGACNGADPSFECAQTAAYAAIEKVEEGDTEFDVVVTFKAPSPDWSAPLATVLPAESVKDPQTFNTGWVGHNNDWYTGPFKLEKIDEAQKLLSVVPNETWWGAAPLLDRITFRELTLDAQPTAFQDGQIDTFNIGVDADGYLIASATPGAEVRKANGPDWRHITFNSTAGLLVDPELRQAIVMGINRQAFADSALAHLPGKNATLGNHFFMADHPGYQDNSDVTPYDKVAAARKVDELGWELNEETGIREKDGKPLAIRFTVFQDVAISQSEGELAREQMREIGVDLWLDAQPTARSNEILSGGEFEVVSFSWVGSPYPLADIGKIYGDPQKNQANYARLNNPELNRLIEENARNTDAEARIAQANQMDRMIWESVHTLPLYQRPQLIAAVSGLANFGAKGYSNPRAEDWGFVAE